MMKLFGALGASSKKRPQHKKDLRYTRFSYHKTRETAVPDAQEAPEQVRQTAPPAAAYRPASHIARASAEPRIDENAHLYSETGVSIAVLRNALPQRFAELR